MDRHEVKIFLAIAVLAILLIAEAIHLWKRWSIRNEAKALGSKDYYLKCLKTEYQELKFRYNTSRNVSEQDKWLKKMKKVERKIIQIENDMESQSNQLNKIYKQ